MSSVTASVVWQKGMDDSWPIHWAHRNCYEAYSLSDLSNILGQSELFHDIQALFFHYDRPIRAVALHAGSLVFCSRALFFTDIVLTVRYSSVSSRLMMPDKRSLFLFYFTVYCSNRVYINFHLVMLFVHVAFKI